MTKAELMEKVGKPVIIHFKDGKKTAGILGYTKEFSHVYGYRHPGMFTCQNWDFRVSHVKKVEDL